LLCYLPHGVTHQPSFQRKRNFSRTGKMVICPEIFAASFVKTAVVLRLNLSCFRGKNHGRESMALVAAAI